MYTIRGNCFRGVPRDMATTKKTMKEAIEAQPDAIPDEEALHESAFDRMIEHELEDSWSG